MCCLQRGRQGAVHLISITVRERRDRGREEMAVIQLPADADVPFPLYHPCRLQVHFLCVYQISATNSHSKLCHPPPFPHHHHDTHPCMMSPLLQLKSHGRKTSSAPSRPRFVPVERASYEDAAIHMLKSLAFYALMLLCLAPPCRPFAAAVRQACDQVPSGHVPQFAD